ncbi:DUF559 domain-containing protein [Nocardioides sp. WS12]|uniref:DUF559 domain-containing protein n=1 Tax=Nocardioides sp. WS12 TaxID=2486272 RepID=UPI0015FC4AC0|nr:DUF559 domain-containing protein [Nocardioides sp. WS12]
MPDLRRPFLRTDALAAGWSDKQLQSSRFQRLHVGIYLDADVDLTPGIRAEAALLPFCAEAFASHATAARLLRIPIPTLPEEHVTVPGDGDRRSRSGVRCHQVPRGSAPSVVLVDGIRVSAPAQVFVELAGQLSLVDLVVVGDHLVRNGRVRIDALRDFCAGWTGRRAAHARVAASFVREKVDSPMESRLRMLILLAGLPEPRVNITYGEDDGLSYRRYDLSWPEVKVIVEYDGRHHIERIEQWESDLDRREAIDDSGWRILVVVSSGIYADPGRTLERIHRLLLARRLPGVPARLRPDWRRHFPGHR